MDALMEGHWNMSRSETLRDRFPTLYHQYHRQVRAVVFNICGGRDLDDLVQEVFVRVWKGLEKFQQRSQLKTWIYRIAINTAFDHCRKQKKLKQEIELTHDIPVEDTKEARLAYQELVQKGLAELPEKHRVVLTLAVMEEMPLKDIAGVLKTSEGTVKSRLHYARKTMMHFLEKNGVSP